MSNPANPTALLIGASRGLGHTIAVELFSRGWDVVGTVRGSARTPLHDVADSSQDRVEVEVLDINDVAGVAALHNRLDGRTFELLFVVAGTTNDEQTPIGDVPTEDFVEVMLTNALSPMRVIERLKDLVPASGLIGAMTSGQGSITNNLTGGREVYRGSKAALNMFLRSFANRDTEKQRALVLMAPGWVQTGLGGPDAPFTIEETVPAVVDVLLAKRARPGLEFLDRFGKTVPW